MSTKEKTSNIPLILCTACAIIVSTLVLFGSIGADKAATEIKQKQVNAMRLNYYNERDASDYSKYEGASSLTGSYAIYNFKLVEISSVLGEKRTKEAGWSPSATLFVGSMSEGKELKNYYFGYAKNSEEAIYLFQIPLDKVRIYQDASDQSYLVGLSDDNDENDWNEYSEFNLHIKPGTAIEKADLGALAGAE